MRINSPHGHSSDSSRRASFIRPWRRSYATFARREYWLTIVVVVLCVLLCWISQAHELAEVNGVMIYLAGVAFIAARFGHGPAILAAFLSVLTYLYFFIPPIFGFKATDTQYFVVLAVMLGIGLLISELTARLRLQLRDARQREHRTSQLYQMTLQLNEHVGDENLVLAAGRYVTDILDSEVMIYLRGLDNSLTQCFGQNTSLADEPDHMAISNWVAQNSRPAGFGTDIFRESSIHYVPMIGSEQTQGVLAAQRSDGGTSLDQENRHMLATCANLIALSIERDRSRADAQEAQVQVHTEQLRNSLLSAVSHDLRTPLATIAVAASSLLHDDLAHNAKLQRENLQVVVDESSRLARQVDNLLEMAQINSGTIVVKRDWHVLEELVGIAVNRMRPDLTQCTVTVHIPDDFPLLWVDDNLIVQVLVNLLDNAVRYSPAGCLIEIVAARFDDKVQVQVMDDGPGLPPGLEKDIFERFVRAPAAVADGRRGMGLGLAISKSIVTLHGGQITAGNRSGGGAEFVIELPCLQENPSLESAETTANT